MDCQLGAEAVRLSLELKKCSAKMNGNVQKLDSSVDGLFQLLIDPQHGFVPDFTDSTDGPSSAEKSKKRCVKKSNDVVAHPAVHIAEFDGKVVIKVDPTVDLSIDKDNEQRISDSVLHNFRMKDLRSMRESHNRTSFVRTVANVVSKAVSSYFSVYTGNQIPKGSPYEFEKEIKTLINESAEKQILALPQPLQNCLKLVKDNEHVEDVLMYMNRDEKRRVFHYAIKVADGKCKNSGKTIDRRIRFEEENIRIDDDEH